ncbi:BCCT family transporter [Neobacillus notoginsengisoli]|uniref:BCCT family transporter n=1 Tax=Neobacillus notoginsengisoli TaxID=1578198 RepID=A0A417YSP3_9BACI|nr:BCCT family transporter [Neobacillus notoginsengisoli]RHW39007.1 BCCT family transporter [Neobacillus notoginsengisoli]
MRKATEVFWYALGISLIVVIWGVLAPRNLSSITSQLTAHIYKDFGWFYLLLVLAILVFCIYLMFSRFGDVKLGKPDDVPEFSRSSWFAMLFSAGMGMGLVFWTTAEPISHAFMSSPLAKEGSAEAVKDALKYSFFHWGVHAWAVYGIVGLVLAYFKFNRGAPGLISATLVPLFGEERMRGPLGKWIDVLAVFATVIGVAATLGFGSAQITGGLHFLIGTPNAFSIQLIVLAVSTFLFIWSAWSGIGKGIKLLSNINMGLAAVLVGLLFFAGPTMYILNMFTNTLGSYISDFFEMSLRLAPLDKEGRNWINGWTIFYWAWWISWAPFVGIFIARISKGRTVKEFLFGVLFLPSLVCFIFFAVFGVSALRLEQLGIAAISEFSLETSTFGVLAEYPLGTFMSFLTVFVIAIFFITSADSATFVLGMLSTDGLLNPSNSVKIAWGLIQSAMAAAVVYFGGTQGLQNMLIIAALPFAIVIILMGTSFLKAVRSEVLVPVKKERVTKTTVVSDRKSSLQKKSLVDN